MNTRLGNTVVIDVDGSVSTVALPADDVLKGAVIRAVLRCPRVDVVRLTSKIDMWIDDEGLYTRPFNPFATQFARRFGYVWQPYHGPALLTCFTADGDTVNMSSDQVEATFRQFGEIFTASDG